MLQRLHICNLALQQTRGLALVGAIAAVLGCNSGIDVADSTGPGGFSQACIDSGQNLIICPATSMARVTRSGAIPYEHPDYDWSDGAVQLHTARNETIGFQMIVQTGEGVLPASMTVRLSGLSAQDNGGTLSTGDFAQTLFTAFYHPLDNAGYSWGPSTKVLDWPASYPDALIPAQAHCPASTQITTSELENEQSPQPSVARASTIRPGTPVPVALPGEAYQNQAVWLDTYVSANVPAGRYRQTLELSINGQLLALPLDINVHNTTLPDKPTIHAVGESYRTYSLEGVGRDAGAPLWRRMSACYQQLAHQHRMVFIERVPDLLEGDQLADYADTINPALTGELFSASAGYIGPGQDLPVGVWRTPWPQRYNGRLAGPITEQVVTEYQQLAADWNTLAGTRGWNDTEFFAYVFDEIDGPAELDPNPESYAAMAHQQIGRIQRAIDNAGGPYPIDLIWTSHSNPAIWADAPGADLTGIVRLWAPNGSAADPAFLQQRIAAGDKAWFYHSGHPAVGAHSINVSGIEMRTWGVIGARYGFQGQFMWALNLGSDERPYREPTYLPQDDRVGNGVLVYPGNQLDKIGVARTPGPVPSMRLKAWRRGLQDAELYYLARARSPVAAESLIRRQMPVALADGRRSPAWSSKPADWIEFHKALLELAGR